MDQKICRTCLRTPPKALSLSEDNQLIQKIKIISSVQISTDDNLPSTVCEECVQNINKFYNFRKVIINSDIELKEKFAVLQKKSSSNVESAETIETRIPIKVELPSDILENESVGITVKNKSDTSSNINKLASLSKMIKTNNSYMTKKTKALSDCRAFVRHPKKIYRCRKCDFSCTESSKWQSHKRKYHYPYGICNICGKSMRADNLGKHIKSHSISPMPCKNCGKIFKNSESLRSHMFVHNGTEHICHICGKIFTYKGDLTKHTRRYHGSQERKEKCTLCEKAFRCKDSLKRHLFTHTGERPYICKYCKKGLSSPYALKTHIRQHTNERPYVCEYCPAAFPQKVSLVTHIKSKHHMDNSNSECDTQQEEIQENKS